MKRIITYLVFVFAVCKIDVAFAQTVDTLAPMLIGTSGNYSTAPFGSISSSVGEPIVTTVSSGTITLTQGFQQSFIQININKITASPNDSICLGNSATLSVSFTTQDVPTTTYNWAPTTGLSCTTCPNPIASPTTSTTYTLTATDITGSDIDSIRIYVLPNPTASVTPTPNDSICAGSSATLSGSATGGSSPYAFVWQPGATVAPAITVTPPSTSTYTLIATDKFGCKGTATKTITVISTPTVTVSGNSPICSGTNDSLAAGISSGIAPYTFTWQPAGGFISGGCSSCFGAVVAPPATATYSISVVDALGCKSDTAKFVLTVDPSPTVTATAPQTICSGQSATLNAFDTGGNSYSWSDAGQTTSSITVSPTITTTYYVVAKGSNGCLDTAFTSITVNPTPTVTASGASTICSGQSSVLLATVSSGTSPFTYQWSPSGTTSSITVSPPVGNNNYSVYVTDVNGCLSNTSSVTVTVNQTPSAPPFANSGTICAGDTLFLSADPSLIGTYNWNGPNSFTANGINVNIPNATTAASGTYSVSVTNSGCTGPATTTTAVINALPSISISPNNPSICFGSNETLTANGGASYFWNTAQAINPISVAPTATTTYSVIGTDANSCTNTASVVVTVNNPPAASINGATTICAGSSALLTETSGAGTYLWSTGATTSSITVNPTSTANYSVIATNSSGCSNTAFATVNVNTPPSAIMGSPSNATCFGSCNGSASVTASGAAPLTYLWSNSQTNSNATGLCGGNYTVTITDGNGCTASNTVIVGEPALLQVATVSSTNVTCNGANDGTATATAGGGITPYTFVWSNGISASSTSGLSATNYTVTITDANGCTADSTVGITEPAVLAANPTGTFTTSCATSADGSADANPSGGTTPYTFAWNDPNNQTTQVATGLAAGNYSVNVTDANNCATTATVAVIAGPTLTPTVSATQTVICSGASTTLTASGGSNYSWWSNNATTSSISVSPTTPTDYSVTVTQGSCSKDTFITIIVNPTPTVSISGTSPICAGNSSTLIATGGGTYAWSNGSGNDTNIVTLTNQTVFTVTVTNSFNCSALNSFTVMVNQPPVAQINGVTNICSGSSTTLTASGGTDYSWSTNQTINPITVTPTASTGYTVNVTDAATGCSDTDTVFVNVVPAPSSTVTATDSTICSGTTITLAASGGSAYTWNTGATTSTISDTPTSTTTYTVTVSNGNCADTATLQVQVSSVSASVSGNNNLCIGDNTTLTATPSGGNSPYTYAWTNGSSTQTTQSIIETYTSAATYNYTATITDAEVYVSIID